MISFECDYDNGAHPLVLEALVRHNDARPTPYGFDDFSERAKQRIEAYKSGGAAREDINLLRAEASLQRALARLKALGTKGEI